MNKLRIKHWRSKLIKFLTQVDREGKIREFLKFFIHEKPLLPEEKIESADPVTFLWPANQNKPVVGLVKERIHRYASWPKFERFLKHNNIPYEYYDVHQSDFIAQAQKFDLLIWHTRSTFAEQWEAKSKIEFLENEMNIDCFPTSRALWCYEDKVRQHWLLEKHDIRAIKTFVSFSKKEAIDYIKSCRYPIVSKEATNSGSEGVFLIKNQTQALKFCNQVFGAGHKVHSSTYLRQKNYVLFQEFMPNDGYDLRITMIGNNYFGYYREVPPGDFRASGSGLIVQKNIPFDALYFAKSIKEKLPHTPYLSVDMLRSKLDEKLYVIEIAIFNRIRTSQQMLIDGIPGKYTFENNEFIFHPCQVWYQDLILVEVLNAWIDQRSSK